MKNTFPKFKIITGIILVAAVFSFYLAYAYAQGTPPQPSSASAPESDNEEDLIEEVEEESSEVDIVLLKTKNPLFGKPKRRPHTPPPDKRARYFQFTSTFDNTDSVAHQVFFASSCTAIVNLRPGKKSIKHTLPVLDDQLSFVEELKRSGAPITCFFKIEGLVDEPGEVVPDSREYANNDISLTMVFTRNGKLRIVY
ncbi:hypothetical protein HYW83_01670 [Candidatus Peregrinibacteria bacterium]|nr:hypothetical protein [Candidatus Peregrinibacteria bacterium]